MPPAYKSLFDSMKNGVLVLDTQERIMDINPQAEKLLELDNTCVGQSAGQKLEIWNEISPKGKAEGIINLKIEKSDVKCD